MIPELELMGARTNQSDKLPGAVGRPDIRARPRPGEGLRCLRDGRRRQGTAASEFTAAVCGWLSLARSWSRR
jgi:hypothetical protein